MQNALLVLSRFNTQALGGQAAVDLAKELRDHGATRADITVDGHYESARHGAHGVSSFERMAADMVRLLNQIVGYSEVYDLPSAMMHNHSATQASGSFIAAEKCFQQMHDRNVSVPAHELRHLAILFYAANIGIRYNWVAFPDISKNASHALFTLGNNIRGREIKTQNPWRPILLEPMRMKIADWNLAPYIPQKRVLH